MPLVVSVNLSLYTVSFLSKRPTKNSPVIKKGEEKNVEVADYKV